MTTRELTTREVMTGERGLPRLPIPATEGTDRVESLPGSPTADRLAWFALAACRGMATELFFPTSGESNLLAKAVCAGCPVRETCAEYAMTHGERFGIWGGLSERGRAAEAKRRRRGGTREESRDRYAASAPSSPVAAFL